MLKKVLALVLKSGARAAEPGEFTKRAFLNGKMDLAQAEAVIDLINSKTDEGSQAAASQLEGRLSGRIKSIRKKLIELIAHIEAVIDYPEHDIEEITGDRIYEGVSIVIKDIQMITEGYDKGRIIREGIRTAIIGKPNAGKSSLLNELAGSDRSIVTDIPGTTRDIIEEYINIRGIPVKILDTAGIRRTPDPVESIAKDADLVIVVLNAGTGISPEDIEILKSIEGKKKIIVINKTDIAQGAETSKMKEQLNCLDMPESTPIVVASMIDGTGMDDLINEIEGLFLKGKLDFNNEVLITNARHKQLMDMAIDSLKSAQAAHKSGLPLDFVTIDIKESAESLGRITGESVSEDVVREIFSRFCIGK